MKQQNLLKRLLRCSTMNITFCSFTKLVLKNFQPLEYSNWKRFCLWVFNIKPFVSWFFIVGVLSKLWNILIFHIVFWLLEVVVFSEIRFSILSCSLIKFSSVSNFIVFNLLNTSFVSLERIVLFSPITLVEGFLRQVC